MTARRLLGQLRRFGPTTLRPSLHEVMTTAIGTVLALWATGGVLWLLVGQGSLLDHPMIIAPFGATAVLIFAVPSSPLAQPWPAIVGNLIAALCGFGAQMLVPHLLPATLIAVLTTLVLTAAARALHPPAGALAVFVVMSAPLGAAPPWPFLLTTVLAGSVFMVLFGVLWHKATGRSYPLHLANAQARSDYGTADARPQERRLPSLPDLAALLSRLHLETTLGPADLAILIAAADVDLAARSQGPVTAAKLMSRDLVTVRPDTELRDLAKLFRQHGFKSLPIRDRLGAFHGTVPQSALVGVSGPNLTAMDLCDQTPATCTPQTPLADLVRRMADGRTQSLVVLSGSELVGLVTRSDLVAGLIRAAAAPSPPA